MLDLYSEDYYTGEIEVETEDGEIKKLNCNQSVKTQRGVIKAYNLEEGDEIWEIL
jgi:hypothetical protein